MGYIEQIKYKKNMKLPKNINKVTLIIAGIIALTHLSALILMPMFPERVASHWNEQGQANGYMSKILGIYLIPLVLTLTTLLFYYIPKLDPLKKNIEKFKSHYEYFILSFAIFMFYLYILTVAWNLGFKFNFSLFMIPAISFLLIYTGFFVEKAKRNWFIGFRTPWTLTNDKVWEHTHKFGGKMFIVCGFISLISLIYPIYTIWFILVPVLTSSFLIFLFSYLAWKHYV